MKKFTFRLRKLLALKRQLLRQAERRLMSSHQQLQQATSAFEISQQDALNRIENVDKAARDGCRPWPEIATLKCSNDRIQQTQDEVKQAMGSYQDAVDHYRGLDSQTRALELVESMQQADHQAKWRTHQYQQLVESAIRRCGHDGGDELR